jgi:hypothetical protein
MPISSAVSTHENLSYSFVNGQFVAVRKMDTPPSTKEVSSEEDENSDGSLEIIPETMKALSLFPVKPENALTRGTDSVSQIASPFRPSKLFCLMFFHAGCKPFDAVPLLCLLVPTRSNVIAPLKVEC